jgi:hypothetical protein
MENRKLLIGLLALLVMPFISCENNVYDFVGDEQNRVFIKPLDNTVNGAKAVQLSVLWNPLEVVKESVSFSISSTLPVSGDVTVSVSVDNSLVDDYNLQNSTHYEAFPKEAVEILDREAIIPTGATKSENVISISVLDEAILDLSVGEYLVGIKLDQVFGDAVISSNRSILYIKVNVSKDEDNIYDIVPEKLEGTLLGEDRTAWQFECENSSIYGSLISVFDNDNQTNIGYNISTLDENTGFIIDMQKEYKNITGICYDFVSKPYGVYCIESSDIYTSKDKKEWIYQGRFDNTLKLANAAFYNPVNARYIKTIVRKYSRMGVYIEELNIYVNN